MITKLGRWSRSRYRPPDDEDGARGVRGGAEILAHRGSLLAFVLRRVRDPALAEDLVQETFAKLLAFQTKTDVRDAAALSYRIAENLIRSHYRKERKAVGAPLEDGLPDGAVPIDDVLVNRERLARFEALLARMPPLRRAVFLRRRVHGESHIEIAAALGLTPAAVEKHVVRALAWLESESAKIAAREKDAS